MGFGSTSNPGRSDRPTDFYRHGWWFDCEEGFEPEGFCPLREGWGDGGWVGLCVGGIERGTEIGLGGVLGGVFLEVLPGR